MKPETAFILAFIAVSYLLWMKIFSISRYMVSFEVLLPIALFVLLSQLFAYDRARRITTWLLSIATIIVILGGARSWGHEGWSTPLYHTDAPSLPDASIATVLLASPDKATAWLATLFPPETAFIGAASSFPGSANFAKKAQDIARTRGGPIFVITDGEDDKSASRASYYDDLATEFGLTTSERGCHLLQRIVTKLHFKVEVTSASPAVDRCRLSVPASEKVDIAASDKVRLERAIAIVSEKGFDIDRQRCSAFTAGIGTGTQRFQLCKASLR